MNFVTPEYGFVLEFPIFFFLLSSLLLNVGKILELLTHSGSCCVRTQWILYELWPAGYTTGTGPQVGTKLGHSRIGQESCETNESLPLACWTCRNCWRNESANQRSWWDLSHLTRGSLRWGSSSLYEVGPLWCLVMTDVQLWSSISMIDTTSVYRTFVRWFCRELPDIWGSNWTWVEWYDVGREKSVLTTDLITVVKVMAALLVR